MLTSGGINLCSKVSDKHLPYCLFTHTHTEVDKAAEEFHSRLLLHSLASLLLLSVLLLTCQPTVTSEQLFNAPLSIPVTFTAGEHKTRLEASERRVFDVRRVRLTLTLQ